MDSPRTAQLRLFLALATLGAGAACSSDGVTLVEPPATQNAPATGEVARQPAEEPEQPVYVLASGVCGPDSCQTYLGTTDRLEPRSVDVRTGGLELEGFVYPFVHHDALLVPEGESPALTRYTLDEAGSLQRGESLSFAGLGVGNSIAAGRARVIDDDKAYLFDEANGVIHLWNPTDLTLSGREIDISIIRRAGQDAFVAGWENAARRRGDLLFVPVGWSDSTTFVSRNVSGMLILDTVNDTVVALLEDSRCPSLESSVLTVAGDLYYGFPSAATMLDVNARDPSIASCSLRIRAGETRFDPEYLLDVSAITGGRVGCGGAPGRGDTAYVQVLHEEHSSITERTELFGSAHNDWRLWRIELDAQTGEEVTSLPWFGTSGVDIFQTEEASYFPMLVFEGESGGLFSNVGRGTTLVDLTSAPEPVPTLSTSGSLLFFGRLR